MLTVLLRFIREKDQKVVRLVVLRQVTVWRMG